MTDSTEKRTVRDLVAKGWLLLTDGYRTRRDQLGEPGLPILRVADVRDDGLVRANGDQVLTTFRHRMGPKTSRSLDALVTTKGTVGRVAQVPHDFPEHVYSPQLCVFRSLEPTKLDPGWLYCWLRSQEFVEQANSHMGQTDMAPYLSLGDLAGFTITVPPFAEQRRIAGVLGALDALIVENRRVADACSELRRTLVQEALKRADATVPLSSTASFVNGRNFTKNASGVGRPVIRTPEIRRGPTGGTVRSDIAAVDDHIARRGDTLFVWSGSLMVSRWFFEDGLVNQHIFKVIPKDGYPDWLVFGLIESQMPLFLSLAADKATTMGHIQRGHLDLPVPSLGPTQVEELGAEVRGLWEEELALRSELLNIEAARAELLPLLLSGRIVVREEAA